MSKFIKNSRISNRPKSVITANSSEYTWFSMGKSKQDKEEDKQVKEYRQKMKLEKQRIESIPLEQLSFKDLYKFPFHRAKYGSWVYDEKSNFIFQFEFKGEETRNRVIDILNGDVLEYKQQDVKLKDGVIYVDDTEFILIRGWGNLTGTGAHNLDEVYAGKIQDTLAEYIVEKLGK